jgi:superoxide dismutase, Fe-Mn family
MYQAKNFDHLLGTPGFSDKLLTTHFGLYQGYVKATNTLMDKLDDLNKANEFGTPEYGEMKRRYGWEFNGMRLHELYFGNMTKESGALAEGSLMTKLSTAYGNYAAWEADFKATASMRGIGWVVLYYDKEADRVFNVWINEHDAGHFSGCTPLLVLDVFEHAFFLDYGAKRADYIEAFMKAVNWEAVEQRLG